MEIIYHTAEIVKNILELEHTLSSGVPTVELDFVMSSDGVPIWTHNILPNQFKDSGFAREKDQLTLFDVLDLNNHRCKLMLDFKYIPKRIQDSIKFYELLGSLNKYDEMQIQSLDLSLVERLKNSSYSNIETGLIINVLTKGYINKKKKLPDVDFLSISSELWEKRNGAYIEKCSNLYPNTKKYAWTWSTRIEDEERINNFIDKNADGIITSNPKLVKTLINHNSLKN